MGIEVKSKLAQLQTINYAQHPADKLQTLAFFHYF